MPGGVFGNLGESAADCEGVERKAPPPCGVSGLVDGTEDADCSLLSSHLWTVNSCVLFDFVII